MMRSMFLLYQIVEGIVFLVALPVYAIGRLFGGRPFGSIIERLGFYRGIALRHDVWLHAVSVGEVNAARIIIERLLERRPELDVVISVTTVTGRRLAESLFPDAKIAWFPFDFTFSVERFLRNNDPRLHVVVETELWPVAVRTTKRAGIPLIMANARISDRSFPRYMQLRPFSTKVLRMVDRIYAREEIDRERLIAMGADGHRAIVSGNVKFDFRPRTEPLAFAPALEAFCEPKTFVFASTAQGEEELLLPIIRFVLAGGARVIIAPRKQGRFDEVAEILEEAGLDPVRRSRLKTGEEIDSSVLLLDSIGELSRVFQYCDAAFIGGSLVPHGGQNPLEACAVGCPVAYGPHMENFRDIASTLEEAGAAMRVEDVEDLELVFATLMDHDSFLEERSRRAREVVEKNRGAVDLIVDGIEELLG